MKKWFTLLCLFLAFPLFAAKKPVKNVDELFIAAETKSAKELRKLLGADKNRANVTRNENEETLLMAALKVDRDYSIIKEILNAEADVFATTTEGCTALMVACQYETHEKVITTLIASSALLKAGKKHYVLLTDAEGKTAFDYALQNPQPDAIIALLSKYADAPFKAPLPDENAVSAIEEEAAPTDTANAEAESAETAIEENQMQSPPPQDFAEADKSAEPEPTPAESTASAQVQDPQPKAEKAATTAETQNEEQTQAPQAKESAVTQTVISAPIIQPWKPTYLLDYAELDNETGITEEDSIDEESFRRNFIAEPDRRDRDGRTLLMKAARDGNIELIEDLLYSQADVQLQDNDGWTALMFAARFQSDITILQRLLKAGAKTGTRNNFGLTALSLAAGFSSNPAIVSLLLEGHSAAEKEIRETFIYAITTGTTTDILTLFLDKGMSLNAPYNGKTPLMYAAETNTHTQLIAWLLKHGAKATYKTTSGMTAFDFAQKNSQLPHNEDYWALNELTIGGR